MLLVTYVALYVLPKLAPAKRELIYQKEWCLRKRLPTF